MAKPPNQELINRLMMEMEEQREVIERAKEARTIMRELNRLIAALGGEPQEVPARRAANRKTTEPVVPMNDEGMWTCPECGRNNFTTPQGLGVHRKMKHAVEGTFRTERPI